MTMHKLVLPSHMRGYNANAYVVGVPGNAWRCDWFGLALYKRGVPVALGKTMSSLCWTCHDTSFCGETKLVSRRDMRLE